MKTSLNGYIPSQNLPVKRGDMVQLERGMLYMYRGTLREVKRPHWVEVHHILPGQSLAVGHVYPGGKFDLDYLRDEDVERIVKVYGHAKLELLWSMMTVSELGTIFLPVSNPQVVWAGSGGYWCDADINQFAS